MATKFTQDIEVDGDVKIDGRIYDSLNSAGTGGQTLQSTGSGTKWAASAGGTIDGSGTAGAFTKWTDSDTVEDSDFVEEDATHLRVLTDALTVVSATKRVGVGTTSPSCTFHVNGNARISGSLADTSNSTGTSGQILSSTGSATSWINAPSSGMSDFTIGGDAGLSNSITDGETLSVLGSTGISTSVSTNTISILNNDRGSSQNIFKNMAVSGGSTITADSNNDTFTFNTGTGVKLLTDTGTDTLTIFPQMTTMLTANLDLNSSSSSSWYYIPFDGQLESTSRQFYHSIVTPFDGYVRGISYRGAGTGTATSATTMKYRVLRNGSVVYTSGSLSLGFGTSSSKNVQLNLTSGDATFDQLHRLEVQIQVNLPIQKGLFSLILQEDT
jgi:hypothetical protein